MMTRIMAARQAATATGAMFWWGISFSTSGLHTAAEEERKHLKKYI